MAKYQLEVKFDTDQGDDDLFFYLLLGLEVLEEHGFVFERDEDGIVYDLYDLVVVEKRMGNEQEAI